MFFGSHLGTSIAIGMFIIAALAFLATILFLPLLSFGAGQGLSKMEYRERYIDPGAVIASAWIFVLTSLFGIFLIIEQISIYAHL